MKMLRIIKAAGFAVAIVGFGGIAWARYLEPEPMLMPGRTPGSVYELNSGWLGRMFGGAAGGPRFVAAQARMGFSIPVYAYARNNPVNYTDATGLYSWRFPCSDAGGVSRGAIYAQTALGYRWIRTPGTVGFDNPNGTQCQDCARAKYLEQDRIFQSETLMTGDCWKAMIEDICAGCKEEQKCPPKEQAPQPPAGYAGP